MARLSAGEAAVFVREVAGESPAAMARALGITIHAVHCHRSNVRRKLGRLRALTEAAAGMEEGA